MLAVQPSLHQMAASAALELARPCLPLEIYMLAVQPSLHQMAASIVA